MCDAEKIGMGQGAPSPTALWVATLRALHQSVDVPPVFVDPLAERILGPEAASRLEMCRPTADQTAPLRATLAARGAFATTAVAEAAARGVRQCVILGAGLDTFAYRHTHADLRVFEVDHPNAQVWKRDLVRGAGIVVPSSLAYVEADFERDDVLTALAGAGFDPKRTAIFVMLGVSLYLDRETLLAIFERIGAQCASGTEFVFDYVEPLERAPEAAQARYQAAMKRVAAGGEHWVTFFTPSELGEALRMRGFTSVTDLDRAAIHMRWFAGRADSLRAAPLTHLVHARTGAPDPSHDPVAPAAWVAHQDA